MPQARLFLEASMQQVCDLRSVFLLRISLIFHIIIVVISCYNDILTFKLVIFFHQILVVGLKTVRLVRPMFFSTWLCLD